jgi:hypothetical protein
MCTRPWVETPVKNFKKRGREKERGKQERERKMRNQAK